MSRAERSASPESGFENRFGLLDKLLHRLAFATGSAQIGLAGLESRLHRRELQDFEPGPPVFVASLPRAGTTALLELIHRLPSFATHTYRDLPFLFCPLLNARLTGRRQAGERRERAHGDGLEIDLESPEAFEERIWAAFWSPHYGESIKPWARCNDPGFLRFFEQHRRSIIALRRRTKPDVVRYASKNNQNIARLGPLLDAIEDATAIVPIRNPLTHAASLHRQHLRFSSMHESDRFARDYMKAIGHFDFGRNLRPIAFHGVENLSEYGTPDQLSWWLAYWEICFGALRTTLADPRVTVLSFERLEEQSTQERLRTALDAPTGAFETAAAALRVPAQRSVDTALLPTDLVERTQKLHAELLIQPSDASTSGGSARS